MKDNFSKQATLYSKFRPGYPKKLFDFIMPLIPEKNAAWDVGTGNGQVAVTLVSHFKKVYASDLSAAQIENAQRKKNIVYTVENAEACSFPDNQFDLITVAQAIHWFNFDKFYLEVKRTLKPGGVLAVIGYDVFKINKKINELIDRFYRQTTGPYWDKELSLIHI